MKTKRLVWKKIKKYFWNFFAIFGPPFQPKKPYLDWKWPKNNIRLILSYDPSFFMFRARKNLKKTIFRSQKGPKRAKKGHFGSNFSKKWKIFKKIFFQFEWFWVEKRPKKRWKNFLLTKLVWHLVIFGQKIGILDFKEFWRFHGFDDYDYICLLHRLSLSSW